MRVPLDAKLITLYQANGVWMANFSGPGSDDIRKLFGGTEIPTPFQDSMEEDRVYREIQHLNPGYTVMLEAKTTPKLVHPEGWQSDGHTPGNE